MTKYLDEYEKRHARCPKCLQTECAETLVGYLLTDIKLKEDYKDLNRCYCTKCGDKHTKHDRVPITWQIA